MIFKQSWLDIRARLASLFRRKEIYQRADEELEFHLAMLEQRIIASGVSPDEARILARRQLGNTTRIKEQTLEAWRYTLVDTLIRDFRPHSGDPRRRRIPEDDGDPVASRPWHHR